MKRLSIAGFLTLFLFASQARATTYNVTTTSGGAVVPPNCASDTSNPKMLCNLKEALTESENNGSDDTINLAAGSGGNYNNANNGNAPFVYNATDGKSLIIIGDPTGQTILDGTSAMGSQIMNLSTTGAGSNIGVLQITFQNSNATSFFAGGLEVRTDAGGIGIQGCTFQNNLGKFFGGVIANSTTGDIDFVDNLLSGNTGGNSGGASINSTAGALTFGNNTFLGNTGNFREGGVSINTDSGPIYFVNNIFSGNKANSTGTGGDGGGIALTSNATDISLLNNTITNNHVSAISDPAQGGGLYATLGSNSAVLNLYNNIIFGNSAAVGEGQDLFVNMTGGPGATVQLFNNDFTEVCFDNGGGTNCDFATFLGGNQANNILNQDPLFINPTNGNFQLGLGSPAIAMGLIIPTLPPLDHDENPRTVGGTVDIGALEAQPAVSVTPNPIGFSDTFVGDPSSQVFTISNNGNQPLQISNVTLLDTTNFSLNLSGGPNPCGTAPFSVNGGDSCTALITFRPQTSGFFSTSINLATDDPLNLLLSLALSGTGITGTISGGGCSLNEITATSGPQFIWMLPMILVLQRFPRRSI